MIRDTNSKAVLSTDRAALDKYRMEKQRVRQIEQLRKDVADLQQTVLNICKIIDKITEEK
jgi:hypothetical protein